MLPELSVVVAVYNEEPSNLKLLLDRLNAIITPEQIPYEVVFVNDGSRALTSKALRDLTEEYDNVKLLELSRNFGQQAAITAGLEHSDGQAVVNIDSDLQDPPELIPEMVRRWREGYDVVYAQRSTRRDKFLKKASAFLFYRVLGAISSVHIPMDTGEYRLMDRKVVDQLKYMPERTRYLRGMVPWMGYRQLGIQIDRGAREQGESTYTLKKLICLAMDGLISFSVAPLYFVALAGAALFGLGVICLAGWALTHINNFTLDGAFIASLISTIAGFQLVCTGIIAIYLSKALEEIRARPTYIVAEQFGLGADGAGTNLKGSRTQFKRMIASRVASTAEQ